MLRVSSTWIEDFRRVLQIEYGNEDQLIARIKGGPFERTWQMQAGTAWHSVLANEPHVKEFQVCDSTYVGVVADTLSIKEGDYYFKEIDVHECQKLIGPGLWEVKYEKLDHVPGFGAVTIVAKCDHILGLTVQDNKATWSNPSAADYELSLQWRLYLWAFQAQRFTYHKYGFRDPKGGFCELRNVSSFSFWPYQNLERDCLSWLGQFLAWAEGKELLSFLEKP